MRARSNKVSKLKLTSVDIDASMQWQAEKRGKRIPPEEERQAMVQRVHQKGHYGVESMFRSLWKEGVWWPKM